MPRTDIEGILEKKVNVLKEKVESKQTELQEIPLFINYLWICFGSYKFPMNIQKLCTPGISFSLYPTESNYSFTYSPGE